jgi:GxxExxY protein
MPGEGSAASRCRGSDSPQRNEGFEGQRMDLNELSNAVIGACIEVHRNTGPGLLESAYERCLCRELDLRDMKFTSQVQLPVQYKGMHLDCGFRIDLLVEERLLIELKSVEKLLPIHEAQVITYLRLGGWKMGLLINFNVPLLKDGIKRLIHNYNP